MMRKKYLQLLLLFTSLSFSQTINFTDNNLKTKLLESNTSNNIAVDADGNNIKIDSNDNNQIEIDEALNVISLDISNGNISDLTGIESFTNLSDLNCSYNNLTHFNYLLPNYLTLFASHNQITSLNITGEKYAEADFSFNYIQNVTLNNTNFGGGTIELNNNFISAINLIGTNTMTYSLNLNNNQINEIDITGLIIDSFNENLFLSNNPLTKIKSNGHQLNTIILNNISSTSLDLTEFKDPYAGNSDYYDNKIKLINCNNLNTIYTKNDFIFSVNCWQENPFETVCSNNALLNIQNCPNLNTICVDEDEKLYIQNQITNQGLQYQIEVTSDCSLPLNNPTFENTNSLSVYPNPSSYELNISNTYNETINYIKIYNTLGQICLNRFGDISKVNISSLENGIYFIKIITDKGEYTKQFIKE